MLFHVVSVDFGNDQRHVRIHSECRRFVECNGICLARDWDKASRNIATRAEESDVDFLERFGVEFLYRDRVTAEPERFPDRPLRANQTQICDRKISALQYAQ